MIHLVKMGRWIVGVIEHRLKNQFSQLRMQNINIAVTHLFDEIKIAAALLNAFRFPLVDHRLVQQNINPIPFCDNNHNHLSEYVLKIHQLQNGCFSTCECQSSRK